MNRTIDRLKLIFLGIFAIGVVAIWAYQILVVVPARRCEGNGQWWDRDRRICAQPLYIPDITGRPAGMSRKEWSEKKAAEDMAREREGYPAGAPAAPAPAAKAAQAAPAPAVAPATPAKK
jgi:hypothetical protein